MAPPESQEVAKPSAWILEKAQNAAMASGVGPDAVARILQKMKAQVQANSEEHQNNVGLLGEEIAELRAKHDLNPFKNLEQPVAADTITVQPKVIIPAQKGFKRKLPPTQGAKSEDPRAKKAKIKKTQPVEEGVSKKAKEDVEKQAEKVKDMRKEKAATKDESVNAVFANSSTAGASQEQAAAAVATATTTTNKPDNTDLVPWNNLSISGNTTDKYHVRTPLPTWYTSINMKGYQMEAMSKKRPPELTALEALKACIKQCEDAKSTVQLDKLYDDLRDHVHKAEIRLVVTLNLIRKANMLSPDYGLPRIFKTGIVFPCDLKADAYQLYNRWWKSDLNQDILRGIVPNKTDNRTSDRLDDTYRKKFSTDAKYYGEGDLVLGQWWPTQLCTVRDGAHGSAQGGIYGEKERGTYSIVLSGGYAYHDVDNGDVIEYSGTPGKHSTPTENTIHLLTSAVLGNPVRVIRSAQLNKKNKYRPELGLRYDGLYQVRGYRNIDQETAMYRFRLERCEGQDPIRFEGKAKRPTLYEVREYERLKDKGAGVW
jgi:hypothetical protein